MVLKFLFSLVILFVVYGCGTARVENVGKSRLELSPESTAQFLTVIMTAGFDLSSDEKHSIYMTNLKHAQDAISILTEGDSDSSFARRLNDLFRLRDKELKKVFSKEQYKVYLRGRSLYEEKLKEFIGLVKERRKEEEKLEQFLLNM